MDDGNSFLSEYNEGRDSSHATGAGEEDKAGFKYAEKSGFRPRRDVPGIDYDILTIP